MSIFGSPAFAGIATVLGGLADAFFANRAVNQARSDATGAANNLRSFLDTIDPSTFFDSSTLSLFGGSIEDALPQLLGFDPATEQFQGFPDFTQFSDVLGEFVPGPTGLVPDQSQQLLPGEVVRQGQVGRLVRDRAGSTPIFDKSGRRIGQRPKFDFVANDPTPNNLVSGGAFQPVDSEFFNFDSSDITEAGQTVADLLEAQQGTNAQTLNAGFLSPGDLFSRINFPDFPADEILSSRLGDISAGRRAAEQSQLQGFTGQQLASGRGLEETQAAQDLLADRFGRDAAQQSQRAQADVAALDFNNQIAKAQLQAGLASDEARTNASLAQTGAALGSQLAGGAGNALLGAAQTAGGLDAQNLLGRLGVEQFNSNLLSQLSQAEAGLNLSQGQAALSALGADISTPGDFGNQLLGQLFNFQGQGATNLLNLLATQAGLQSNIAGIESSLPNFTFQPGQILVGGLNAFNQAKAADRKPKKSSGFSATIFGTGGGFNSGCVDGWCLVPTPNGIQPLHAIEVGQKVIAADGTEKKVLATDFGYVPEDQRDSHVLIQTNQGALRATDDHSIGGKRADAWMPGDRIPMFSGHAKVTKVGRTRYVDSGDLYLEGNADWVADGFIVQSSLAKIIEAVGVEAWESLEQVTA